MNQQQPFSLGEPRYGQATSVKRTWHKLIAGDNIYRILPPVFSLAGEGRWYAFWRFHGGFKNTQGQTQMFQCIEEKDKKSKALTTHCPVCDMVYQQTVQYENLKAAAAAGQISQEEVKKFWNEQIFPYKVQKAFFVNAMDRQGEAGILSLPYKAWQAVDAAVKKASDNFGLSAIGINGAWIKITKVQAYPGSIDVSYGADIHYEMATDGRLDVKRHTLTAEIVQNVLSKSMRDLGTLYRTVGAEELNLLATTPVAQRAAVVDRVFGKREQNVTQDSPLAVQMPGTQATLVGRVEHNPGGGVNVVMPQAPAPVAATVPYYPNNGATIAPQTQPQPLPFVQVPNPGQGGQYAQPVPQYAQPPVGAVPTVPTVPAPPKLTEDQFNAVFGQPRQTNS